MSELISPEALSAFFQVIFIDLVLAGDNAIVIGLAASGLPREQRNKAILVGIIAATVLRIIFASITTWLLAIVGLLVAGGILLLWVCWKMWRELRTTAQEAHAAQEALADEDLDRSGGIAEGAPRKTFGQAALQIIIADVSMSLDNVLAVAGAAREHPVVLVFGLALSIALMGAAASLIANLLQRHRWIAYVGLAIIFYVALSMIWEGSLEVIDHVEASAGF
jgi:YjbE family integral membrane protein